MAKWLGGGKRYDYLGYVALLDDARAYEDVLIAMAGEAYAGKIADVERMARGE